MIFCPIFGPPDYAVLSLAPQVCVKPRQVLYDKVESSDKVIMVVVSYYPGGESLEQLWWGNPSQPPQWWLISFVNHDKIGLGWCNFRNLFFEKIVNVSPYHGLFIPLTTKPWLIQSTPIQFPSMNQLKTKQPSGPVTLKTCVMLCQLLNKEGSFIVHSDYASTIGLYLKPSQSELVNQWIIIQLSWWP